MIAAGIDLGGTKIEAQVFGDDWQLAARKRWTCLLYTSDAADE